MTDTKRRPKQYWASGPKRDPTCYDGEPDCDNCHNLSFIEAKPSEFHDPTLIKATREINGIFDGLREKAPSDRHHLALINTGLGLLLIWALKGNRPDDTSDLVTYWSTSDEIIQALNLPDPEAATKRPASAGHSDPKGGSTG